MTEKHNDFIFSSQKKRYFSPLFKSQTTYSGSGCQAGATKKSSPFKCIHQKSFSFGKNSVLNKHALKSVT